MAAPMWKSALDDYVKTEIDSMAPDVVKLLTDNTISLLELIEGLGKYLISEETSERGRVVKLLAEILHLIPTDKLNATENELLVAYLCDRLKDHHSIQPPSLHGLLALCHSKNLPEGCPEKICRSIFSEVQTQTLSQGDRRIAYNIFSVLLTTSLPELQKIGSDFVLGYIQAMDAEKDPRNLVIAFHCATTIIRNFQLGVFVEEMFEVVSCYFPVDFTPPPGDPNGVTKEDLILGLRGCLAASGQFGQYCCPLLLEKLSSDVTSAKVDSLRTLEAAAKVYGSKCLLEYRTSLFGCIKREVFGSGDEELEAAALLALTAMTTTFSQETIITDSQTCAEEFVSEIWNECSRYLGDDDLRLMVPTCRLLCAVAAGSEVTCCKVLSLVVTRLVQIFYSHPQASDRKAVMESIHSFLRVTRQIRSEKVKKSISEFQNSVYAVVMSAISESNVQLRVAAVQCLDTFLQLPLTLAVTDPPVMAKVLVDRAFTDEDKDVRFSCCSVLSTMAKTDAATLKSVVLPCLLEKLRTKPMDVDGSDPEQHHMVFTALAAISVTTEILSLVVKELVSYLSCLAQMSTGEPDVQSVASCLSVITTSAVSRPDMLTVLYSHTLPELFSLLVSMATDSSHHNSCVHNEDVLQHLTTCVRQIVVHLNEKRLTELCRCLTQLYLHNETAYLSCTPSTPFYPLQTSSPWQQTELITLASPVICSCPVEVLESSLSDYSQQLWSLSLQSDHKLTRRTAAKCLAGLINRWPTGESLLNFLQSSIDTINSVLGSDTVEGRKRAALNQLIWFTKALAMRGHSKAKDFISMLTNLLDDQSIGELAATGFEIILGDFPDVLSKPLGANIRIMYKQRIFVENVGRLKEGFASSPPATKKNYLICLSHMLKILPKQVLLSELPPLFPLMVHSLLCDDLDLQLSTMTILCDLTHDAPDVISKHVDTLVPQLLQLCTHPSSMKIRIKALRCISALCVLPVHLLLPYKTRVVRSLEPVLDDRKRLVRREAVTARSEWCLIGDPS
ncbi:MMS19 nucleotide excision repair protein homolog [Mizuhopecten yessoensis]|uniref:MMS19 nucleotide excision repair protein n=1 Tax=Mizuhopecten yessoensis TaxID=6573 RepID=A0A210R1X6_MIZYE|nr:MMS19 nucleotide excision repair protein homolog [Mizuhopecten yessoensis]OWF55073.1 MMS19 nucleotide excision repair protein-like [Mizuhopecten yessoensis]